MQNRKLGKNLEVRQLDSAAWGSAKDTGRGRTSTRQLISCGRPSVWAARFSTPAEGYGAGANEALVGRALAPICDKVVLARKFFIAGPISHAELGKAIRARLDASLVRLGTDHVELYYQHRVPDSIPVEDVAAVMGELIVEGKILGWGQSQATEQQIAERMPLGRNQFCVRLHISTAAARKLRGQRRSVSQSEFQGLCPPLAQGLGATAMALVRSTMSQYR
jgi:aryl-alcohol dehydrogenase-like predicted oxidoreductase